MNSAPTRNEEAVKTFMALWKEFQALKLAVRSFSEIVWVDANTGRHRA